MAFFWGRSKPNQISKIYNDRIECSYLDKSYQLTVIKGSIFQASESPYINFIPEGNSIIELGFKGAHLAPA